MLFFGAVYYVPGNTLILDIECWIMNINSESLIVNSE
jgi:hypothetical protein